MNRSPIKSLPVIRLIMVLLFLLVTIVTTKAEQQAPLGFGMYRYEQHSQLNADTHWKCDYPVFEPSLVGNRINAVLLGEVVRQTPLPEMNAAPKTIQEAATVFITESERIQKSDKERHWGGWESEINGQVLLDRPGIVTVSISSYAFTGGAHGMSITTFLVFDAETGRQLTLDDLFVPGFARPLDRLIEKHFRKLRNLSLQEPLNGNKGGLFEDRITHNRNFAITGSGIRFLYNQYDIAPYASGQIDIELPFQELRKLLNPQIAIIPLLHDTTNPEK